LQEVRLAYERKKPLTVHQLYGFARDWLQVDVSTNTMHHIMSRISSIKSVTAIPMDEKRLKVTTDQIKEYFANLFANVSGAPAHFVFNMDEMGHQTWSDAHNKTCFVPSDHPGDEMFYPVSRTGKRITLVACVAADGSFLKPAVVVSRKPVDLDLVTIGLTAEKVELFHQAKAYIDQSIFHDWLDSTFVSEVERRRQDRQHKGPAFLMLDNCTAHTTTRFAQICQDHRIVPIFLPPHSFNQLQVLDLSLFGVTKRLIAHVNRMEGVTVQTMHVSDVVNAFIAACTPINVVKSLRNAGISLLSDETHEIICQITPETTRCVIDGEGLLEVIEVPDEEEEKDPNVTAFLEICASLLYDIS
jgi:hypothetical protein